MTLSNFIVISVVSAQAKELIRKKKPKTLKKGAHRSGIVAIILYSKSRRDQFHGCAI